MASHWCDDGRDNLLPLTNDAYIFWRGGHSLLHHTQPNVQTDKKLFFFNYKFHQAPENYTSQYVNYEFISPAKNCDVRKFNSPNFFFSYFQYKTELIITTRTLVMSVLYFAWPCFRPMTSGKYSRP